MPQPSLPMRVYCGSVQVLESLLCFLCRSWREYRLCLVRNCLLLFHNKSYGASSLIRPFIILQVELVLLFTRTVAVCDVFTRWRITQTSERDRVPTQTKLTRVCFVRMKSEMLVFKQTRESPGSGLKRHVVRPQPIKVMVSVNPLFTALVSLQIKIMELYSKIFKNKAKVVQPFNPWELQASNFSLQCHPWIKHWGHENKGNDNQLKNLLIVVQILLASASEHVWRTVWRICILMLGCKGSTERLQLSMFSQVVKISINEKEGFHIEF